MVYTKIIETVEDIKSFEQVSEKCSNKYIPMKTSDFVNTINDYKFEYGRQYRKGSSGHYVRLSKGSDIDLYIMKSCCIEII